MSLSRRRFFAVSGTAGAAAAAGMATPRLRDVNAETLAEAQEVFGLDFTDKERELMVGSAARRANSLKALRQGRDLANGLAPMAAFDPRLPGFAPVARPVGFRPARIEAGDCPDNDEDLAFAPAWAQSQWLATRKLTSERLTALYLKRLKAAQATLLCSVTILEESAMAEARRADAEIAAGKRRGPLHGLPYGAKDLFDAADTPTTWGAAPFKDRVATGDAWVVQRMRAAGAVLATKTTLGALAMGDVWFGGRTRNPFDPTRGSSGSSAGSASATGAGLVSFAIGTETLGSIVSPCMRCGTTGLRPTFGRVGRGGAMALSWSMDKAGPITRCAEDGILVLNALRGLDSADASCTDLPLHYDGAWEVKGRRVGYVKEWFEGRRASDADRACLEAAKAAGLALVPIQVPSDPMDSELRTILSTEAAAAFEKLTLSNRDDLLTRQNSGAWPDSFRRAWFTSAVDLMQAMRHRRSVCHRMTDVMDGLDAYIGPSYAGNMLLLTNSSGHPSLTIRSGFRRDRPTCTTLVGHLYDEGMLVRIGRAIEGELGVWERRPEQSW